MTTAHRPTFDPARGREALRGPAYHQRLLPAHKTLKTRKPGQIHESRDLRAELLNAEAAHYAKKSGGALDDDDDEDDDGEGATTKGPKRMLDDSLRDDDGDEDEDPEVKRRRLILEAARDEDADSESSSEESSSEEEDSDDEDGDAALQRELEKIRKERAEAKAKEEAERAAKEQEQREFDIAKGNPLLNPQDFGHKRRWDDDVVFKNQARGTEDNKDKNFVNDLLRSDFHKRFMSKYVR